MTSEKQVHSNWIEYTDSLGQPTRLRLSPQLLVIGRDPSSDVHFEPSIVSRFHAEIRFTGGRYFVVDTGSRHGVRVNGEKVEEHALVDGDVIRLGDVGAPSIVFHSRSRAAELTAEAAAGAGAATLKRELKAIAGLLDTFLALKGDLLLDDLLEIVVERSIEMAGADRGMILLVDEDAASAGKTGGDELRVAMARDREGSPIEPEGLRISRKIPHAVLRTGRGAILEDLLAPDARQEHPATVEIGVRSAMCVPLRTRVAGKAPRDDATILGVLYVDSTSRTEPFSPQALRTFESLAVEAAQAIFNARLYEVSLQKRRLDEEMRIAHSIQQNILPPADFECGWLVIHGSSEPSRDVGGDFWGYQPMTGGGLGITVGDVSGKGIPAAIVAAMLDGLCHGLAALPAGAPNLGEVARLLNRYMVEKSSDQKFVSLFYAALRDNGRLAYFNAGHNPPLRIDAAGASEELRTGGMLLGVIEDATYTTREIQLQPGDRLCLYSDGITEARNARGEFFGTERLIEAAAGAPSPEPRATHDAILQKLEDFLAGTPPGDDVTLVVARYLGPGSGVTSPGAG